MDVLLPPETTPLEMMGPAIENIRSRGLSLAGNRARALLEPNKYLVLTRVWVDSYSELHDRNGDEFLLPMLLETVDPVTGYNDMIRWNDDLHALLRSVPMVYGKLAEPRYTGLIPWIYFDEVAPYLYWDCLLLDEDQAHMVLSWQDRVSEQIGNAGVELYQHLMALFECGEIDAEWAYLVNIGSDLLTDADYSLLDEYLEHGDEYEIEEAAQMWDHHLEIESNGGLFHQIPPLEEISTPQEFSLLRRLESQRRTEPRQYDRSVRSAEMTKFALNELYTIERIAT